MKHAKHPFEGFPNLTGNPCYGEEDGKEAEFFGVISSVEILDDGSYLAIYVGEEDEKKEIGGFTPYQGLWGWDGSTFEVFFKGIGRLFVPHARPTSSI